LGGELAYLTEYRESKMLAPLLFCSDKTVSEPDLLNRWSCSLQRKQIPRIVVNVNS
jgi:hypothetical protein